MKRKIWRLLLFIYLLALPSLVWSQANNWHYSVEGQAITTPSDKLPFWFRADQYGAVPLSGTSAAFTGDIYKGYDTTKTHGFDWSTGFEARANMGNYSYLTLLQGYVKAKAGIFELKVGRTNDVIGLIDTTLSSGAFSVSGNALGIPKAELSIPEYYSFPFTSNLISIKGGGAFGYVGDVPLIHSLISHAITYYVEEQLYGRLGKPQWRLSLYAGINHEVYYGGERGIYGPTAYFLSPLQSLIYAATGKTYTPPRSHNNNNGSQSKVGNHLGSVDLGLQYEFSSVRLFLYRQNIYDVGALAHLANIADGVNGLSLTNKKNTSNLIRWHKFVFEFVYTANQAGYLNSIKVKSGDEDYYNNSIYQQGWTYDGLNLGNPLVATRQYTRKGLVTDPDDYYINNRVKAFQTGLDGSVGSINVLLKLTYSQNFGTFGTSPDGHSLGYHHFPPQYGLFGEVNQFSCYLELNKPFGKGYTAGLAAAADDGGLYYNSVGVLLKLRKSFR